MITIYAITNDIDDGVYIGKTSRSLRRRFNEHTSERKKPRSKEKPLYVAMNAVGIEHFSCHAIERCDESSADERERFWIDLLDDSGTVYNIAPGGPGRPKYDHATIAKELEKTPYVDEVAKQLGCCEETVYQVAKENNIKTKGKREYKIVEQIEDGKVINIFESVRDAADWCKSHGQDANGENVRENIRRCIVGKRKSAYGYYWRAS